MKPKFWTSEKLLSLSALLVSLGTLMVFIYQTRLIQIQQYRSVYPHVLLSNAYYPSLNYQYIMVNNGIGPAIITQIEVRDTLGNTYESLNDYLTAYWKLEDSIWIYNSDIYVGRLIPAKEKVVLYGLHDEEATQKMGLPPNTLAGCEKLHELLTGGLMEVQITYESIYGETWVVSNHYPIPEKQ